MCACASFSAQQLFGFGSELFVDVCCDVIRQLLDLLVEGKTPKKHVKTCRWIGAEETVGFVSCISEMILQTDGKFKEFAHRAGNLQ